MADSTIQQLPAAGSVNSTDLTIVDQSGVTRSTTMAKLAVILGQLYNNILGIWTRTQVCAVTSLTVSANAIAVDLSLTNNFSVTLQSGSSQVLSNPLNALPGTSGQIAITQNGATASTLTYGTSWLSVDGSTPLVSTTLGALNLLTFYVVDSTHVFFSIARHGVA